MKATVFDGKVDYIQIMDENGKVDQDLLPKNISDGDITKMYNYMAYARALDEKMLSLQRQGRAVTYAPLVGEEATQVGSALALREGDLFVPNFRQHGVFLVRGMPLDLFFLYWRGFEEGGSIPEEVGGFPVCVPVASQMPHAAGIAFAQTHLKTGKAVITYVGDGGTSEGDFYETINFAGVFKAPLVTIIENNQWAISVPRKKQSAAQTLAQKGFAAGIRVVQVDGNDVLAVYAATKDAVDTSTQGPTLIECVTYRMSMHTTADDPTKYRPEEDVAKWMAKDPIERVRKYLVSKGLWDDKKESEMREAHKSAIDAGVDKAEKFVPDPKSMFDNVYSYVPQTLKDELDSAVASDFYTKAN